MSNKTKTAAKNSGRRRSSRRGALVSLSLLAASALGVAGGAGPAFAQNVNCAVPLIFGTIEACGGAGTVSITPDGVRSSSGCISVNGPSSRGLCILTGSLFPVKPMQVMITAPTFTITNGTSHMDVKAFDLDTSSNGFPALDHTITVTSFIVGVNIGATLHVGANQPAGNYSGSATISVNFQ